MSDNILPIVQSDLPNTPKADPKPEQAEKPKKDKEKVDPVYVKNMYKLCRNNASHVGRLLGCSGNTISTAISKGQVSPHTERCAELWWDRYGPDRDQPYMIVVQVPDEEDAVALVKHLRDDLKTDPKCIRIDIADDVFSVEE